MTRQFYLVPSLCVALFALALFPVSAAAPKPTQKILSAHAEFLINPTGKRETHCIIDVYQGKTSTDVHFIYNVQSTSEEGDFLFYHSISGDDSIPRRDFKIDKSLKSARLCTILPVFDDEGGVDFEMLINVEWNATGRERNGTRPATASLKVDSSFNNPSITQKIRKSIDASLSSD